MEKIAIIGAGAAGCFCAVEMKRRRPGAQITVFESATKPLAKVAITGGGRCNLTNSFESIGRLREAYPRGERLVRHAFSQLSPEQTCAWWEREGVRLVTMEDGCVFPASQDAMQIVRTLENLMRRAGLREDIRWAEMGSKGISRLACTLTADAYSIAGRCHFKEEFVTAGGVSADAVLPKAFEAREHPHLHFAGEVLDIDAITGGFNLQAAWSTAYTVASQAE